MTKNLHLEGLRGLAALWVFGSHFLMWESFSPNGKLINAYFTTLLASFTPGHLGVLYFFILSGYVMGKAYPWDKDLLVFQFLLKRWVRIWPMYAIAIGFSCLVSPSHFWQVVGHLVFLNPDLVPPIQGNPVLWSISYEFWFYLFLPIIFAIPLFRSNKAIPILIISILISIIQYTYMQDALIQMIFRWFGGLSFWLLGLVIAWKTIIHEEINSTVDNKKLWSGLLMSMAFSPCTAAFLFMLKSARLPVEILGATSPSIGDFIYLPMILTVFFCLIKIKLSEWLNRIIFYLSLILLMSIILFSLANGKFWIIPSYPAVLFIVLIAMISKYNRIDWALDSLAPIGAISYGIYIFHVPTMILIGKIPSFSGGWIEWFVRAIVSIVATLAIAYMVEIRLQPKLKDFFISKISKPVSL